MAANGMFYSDMVHLQNERQLIASNPDIGTVCNYGEVRLVGGSNQYEGGVEVCINDQWGTVCDNSWGTTDATLVCKQLGYAYTSSKCMYCT